MTRRTVLVVLTAAGLLLGSTAIWAAGQQESRGGPPGARVLKSVTINTGAYSVPGKGIDRRSDSITAEEDMHIVGIEHFTGVQLGVWSDNGHILSVSDQNPWTKWAQAGTGMEPTGTKGYFGYCGRDYYREVGGIGDVTQYEMLPAGTYMLVRRGQKIYMHCYANNFLAEPKMFHHAVRLLYW